MKTSYLLPLGAFLATFTFASAQDKPKRPAGPPREVPAKVIEKFDKDGDGKLSKPERQALREQRKTRMLAKFDTDKNGVLSDAERVAMKAERESMRTERAARQARRQELLKKYDANTSGRLDPEEIKAAKAAGEDIPRFKGGPNGKKAGKGNGSPSGPPPQP